MYFGLLPPEINSGLMYAGPGSGSMAAAATAWDGLAAQLHATAASYSSVLSGLATTWRGPSATSMATAAAPYVSWLTATASQAEETAALARAAVAAFETAFGATVPPQVVQANRSELSSLVATNVLGQNSAAIAALEAQYSQMWARDATAMETYAAQSAAAATVPPFVPAPSSIDPRGVLGHLFETLQTLATSAGFSARTQFSQLFGAVPAALSSFGTIMTGPDPAGGLLATLQDFAGLQTLSSISADLELIPKFILPANCALINTIMGLVIGTKGAEAAAASTAAPGVVSAVPHLAGAAVTAEAGRAGLIGGMSVPPSWAIATPAVRTVAAVLSGAADNVVSAADVTEGTLLSGTALAGAAGSAFGAAAPTSLCGARFRSTSLKDPWRRDAESPTNLQRLVADMAQNPDDVQHWYTDSTQLESLVEKLKTKPGIHAVHLSDGDMNMPLTALKECTSKATISH